MARVDGVASRPSARMASLILITADRVDIGTQSKMGQQGQKKIGDYFIQIGDFGEQNRGLFFEK